jgi:diguanylate cyclase (GGDEF)-like protein
VSATTAEIERLQGIRQQLLDRIWQGVLVLALIGTPASVSRAFSTGWLPLYTFHAALAVFVVAMFLLRRRLSYMTRVVALLCVFFLVGTAGIFTLGLLGAGVWWLVMSSLVAGTLMSRRFGLVVSLMSASLIGLAALGFTRGVLKVPVDPAVYVYDVTSWISFFMAASLLPFVVFQAIVLFQRSTADLVGEIERQRAQIQQLASHDPVTGLPRWDLVVDRLGIALAAARRGGRKVAFLFIDLDGFKAVNDSLGHDAGDRVLAEVGARLRAALRDEDTAGRIGGDEFVVILGQLADASEAVQAADRLIAAIRAPVAVGAEETRVGASVGIAMFPDHGGDARELRLHADAAMYAAKGAGKNRSALARAA